MGGQSTSRPVNGGRGRGVADTPMGYHPAMGETTGRASGTHGRPRPRRFRHSYSKDKAQLVRRLSRIEGQVRGIARMIEREEYCVDILQQTAALRAAVDAVSIMVLEDHVQGCVRTAAERGEADKYVDEVLDVVRRTLGRPVRGAKTGELSPRADPRGATGSCPRVRGGRARFVDNALDGASGVPLPSALRRNACALGDASSRGAPGRPGPEPTGCRETD